jgi:DNA-binding response OmpR family regulator
MDSKADDRLSNPRDDARSAVDFPATGMILVIDDDPRTAKTLQRLFTLEGYEVRRARTGAQGLDSFAACSPDAIILDLILPDISGEEICRSTKQSSPDVPVIILSASSEIANKVELLNLGADDFVSKPFSPRELLARVQAAIRRSRRPVRQATNTFGDVELNFTSMTATKRGKSVPVTAHEFKLLRFFLEHLERVITREELLSEVWGYEHYPSTRTVDTQVLKLRQKLEDNPADPVHFCTIRGAGYRFVRVPLGS